MAFQIKDVRDHRKENRMESFFLAETTKYLYLLFDTDNFIHNQGNHGTIVNTSSGECIVEAGGYIFNTEAHPIDPSALHCCQQMSNEKQQLFDFNDFNRERRRMFRGETIYTRNQNQKSQTPDDIPVPQNESDPIQDDTVVEAKAVIVPLDEEDNTSITTVATTDQMKFENPLNEENISTNSSASSHLFCEQEGSFLAVPEILKQTLLFSENSSSNQDPQQMLERIRTENRYPANSSWEVNYKLLSCKAQPFLQRISILGEVF